MTVLHYSGNFSSRTWKKYCTQPGVAGDERADFEAEHDALRGSGTMIACGG